MNVITGKRISIVFILVLIVTIVSALPGMAGASSAGFPMYSWGNNTTGQLGLGNSGSGTHRGVPHRVGTASNWVKAVTGSGASAAINTEGHLYVWGANWNDPQMGQGDNPSPGTGNITVPTRVGIADNWTYVAVRGTSAAAINFDGQLFTWGSGIGNGANVPTQLGTASNWQSITNAQHRAFALNDQGYLYSWGISGSSLGHGSGNNHERILPERVGDRSDWVALSASGATHGSIIGLTESGHIYTWGSNAFGQLGNGTTSSVGEPTRLEVGGGWISVAMTSEAAVAAINENGHLYTWGHASVGQHGHGDEVGGVDRRVPTRVGTADDWVFLVAANSHFLALNDSYELWSWGNNNNGQLGIGVIGSNRPSLQLVVQTYGFSGAARGGGTQSLMLIHTEPVDASFDLVKYVQKPEGTDLFANKNFVFSFERLSFNENVNNAALVPEIPNKELTVGPASPSITAGGIITSVGTVNILEDVEFAQAGVFAWIVREVADTSGTIAPSNMDYSLAAFEVRAYVSQAGIGADLTVDAITVHKTYNRDGERLVPPVKTDDFVFENIYTRTTTGTDDCYGALVVSKNVTGPFAPLDTIFDFEVTVTRTALCLPTVNFTGQVYNANGTTSGAPITFTPDTATMVGLTHGQRLVFDEFVVGTRFAVTELAHPVFTASVALLINGESVTIAPNENPDQDLSTGIHIAGDAENSAAFTNDHFFVPPTGLSIGGAPIALPIVALFMVLALIALKGRKSIEELTPPCNEKAFH